MSFRPINFDQGRVLSLLLASGTTVTKSQLLKYSSGYLVDAATDDDEAEYIALETVTDGTASDGGTSVEVLPIYDGLLIVGTCSTTPVQASHVGNSYDLTGANTINLAASTDKLFFIHKIYDATNKLVICSVNKPAIA